jgi:hypothetical protein
MVVARITYLLLIGGLAILLAGLVALRTGTDPTPPDLIKTGMLMVVGSLTFYIVAVLVRSDQEQP